ncbi:histone methylation protein DOT1-domain-containing protein [Echria macrotheca]|uniref:Histone-lysine N-methyltransferase, H3 lysine-79 specific n=1 Tax=Echria macrotheca TaxID=438768 RepID=A0AAJ0F7Z0_9PEZI|nr:histone methylation protein DOT1-domain-containing protein [Echria macrotheca]
MSIFNQKSKFKVKTEIRTIRQAVEPTQPKAHPATVNTGAKHSSAQGPKAKNSSSSLSSTPRASPKPRPAGGAGSHLTVAAAERNNRKRRAGSNRPAASPNFSESDNSDDDEDWVERLDARKRRKRADEARHQEDPNRVLRHPKLWDGVDEADTARLPIIHAVQLASLEEKCQPALGLARDRVSVKLQYPGARYPERYELVTGKDKIDAVRDILKVVDLVTSTYLTEDEARDFLNPNSGIYRRLQKSSSSNRPDGLSFKIALREYNERLLSLQRKGAISKNLGAMRRLPWDLVDFILDQVYDRTVAPKIELLKKYENGTDNVYGELKHPLISKILERTAATSDKVFVDLGSGVGNVVVQAALEIGCESWGCEMMENACNLADAQQKEFMARCRLWGISHGEVHLERGDFRKNQNILDALKRADIVLVNNQAFTSQLNDNLVNMFLDLKPGCKIISLKTFVHDNKIAENDVATSILDVEHLTYPECSVSWTDSAGTYCISTRKG